MFNYFYYYLGFLIKNDAEKGDEDAFMCGAFYKEAELQTQEE